jgi:hypothetical protein
VKCVDLNSWANAQPPATTKSSENTHTGEVSILLFIEDLPFAALRRTDTMEQIGRGPQAVKGGSTAFSSPCR